MPLGRTAHIPRHSKLAPEPRRPESTLDALYRQHGPAARRYATTLTGSGEEADDLAAAALLQVLGEARRALGFDTGARSHLFATMRYMQEGRPAATPPPLPRQQDPSALAGFDGERRAVDREHATAAFRSLPTRWQAVLVLTAVEGLRQAEVAERLGCSPGATSILAFRAREGLRASYVQQGVPPSADRSCAAVRGRLGRWGRGSLSPRERTLVEDHLRVCVDCDSVALWVTEESKRVRRMGMPLLMSAVSPSFRSLSAVGAGGVEITAPGALRISRGALVAAGAAVVAGTLGAAMALSPVGGPLSGPSAGIPGTPGNAGSSALTSSGWPLGPGSSGSGLSGSGSAASVSPGSGSPRSARAPGSYRPGVAGSQGDPTLSFGTQGQTAHGTTSGSATRSGSGRWGASSAATASGVALVYSDGHRSAVVWTSAPRPGALVTLSGLPPDAVVSAPGATCQAAGIGSDVACAIDEGVGATITVSASSWWCTPTSSGESHRAEGTRLRLTCSRVALTPP